MKKIIGIGGNLMFDAAGMFPGYPRAYVNHDYVAAVKAAGAVPLVLPVLSDVECVERQLSGCFGSAPPSPGSAKLFASAIWATVPCSFHCC